MKRIKGRTIISHKQNVENKFFQISFMDLKIKIKKKVQTENKTHRDKILNINSIQLIQNLSSFQTPFEFLICIHWLWRYNV